MDEDKNKETTWLMMPGETRKIMDKTNEIVRHIDSITETKEEKAAITCFLMASFEKEHGEIEQSSKEEIKAFVNQNIGEKTE